MTRTVLDTNAIVSGIGWSGPPRFILDAAIREQFTWLMSQDLLDEVRRVLAYPKLRSLPQQLVQEVLALIPLVASMVEPEQRLKVVQRDPMDNIVLECAVAGEAASIVTGDEDLLGLHSFRSITICTPATFQSILRSTHP